MSKLKETFINITIFAFVKRNRNQAVLVGLGLLFFLPFLGSVHLFDWDEINFAEAAREMIVTGNYMRVMIDFQPFWEKPPLFFWLQALSMHLFGVNEFAARFVNAFCGIITLLIVYAMGKKLYDSSFGFLWALAFLGSLLPHILFKSGIIDPWFNLFIFLGICSLFQATAGEAEKRLGRFAAAGLWAGLAVLTKGPVALLLVILCWSIYWIGTRFKRIFFLREVAVFIGAACFIASLFYGLETLLHGTWFVREFFRYHLRLFGNHESGHLRPYYYHFFVLLFGCFPASILAVRSLYLKVRENDPRRDFNRWMSILFWVVLAVFSIVKTKTVLYSSLAYFPITFFAARHVYYIIQREIEWTRGQRVLLAVFGVVISMLFSALPLIMVNREAIAPLIRDKFAAACMLGPGKWTVVDSLVGALYLLGIVISCVILAKKKYKEGFIALFIACAIGVQSVMIAFTGRVERHFQGAPIEFYKSLQGKNCYIKPLFKTYAHLFYAKKQPPQNSRSYDKEWLLTGDIDKTVYFVARVDKADRIMEKYGLPINKKEGGFVFFKREISTVEESIR